MTYSLTPPDSNLTVPIGYNPLREVPSVRVVETGAFNKTPYIMHAHTHT